MSYRVFARKYRPQKFEEVIGQEHITRTLQNAIKGSRLAQAYLFVGPRGVGKTSTARILAKALNCQNGPTDNPCGTCDACIEIAEGRSLDVMEIDGASNNSVESIRTLRENAAYAPARGPYKVYLIDEVHMLTTAAFIISGLTNGFNFKALQSTITAKSASIISNLTIKHLFLFLRVILKYFLMQIDIL